MADDTDTLDDLRRPYFENDQGDQTAQFLSNEYESPSDAIAAGVDPNYAAEKFRAAGMHDLADQYAAVSQPAAPEPAAPAAPAPIPAWDTVASHPDFQQLTPDAKQAVVDQYATHARDFALTLPDAPDSAALGDHFNQWAQVTKDRLVNPLTPEQSAAIQPTAAEQRTLTAPEGSPEAQDIARAQPLFSNEIPSATAQAPTLDQTIAASLPQFPASVQVPLAPPDTSDIGTRSLSEAYQQGGILGGLDYASEQLPLQAASATKKFLDVVTLPDTLFASPEEKQSIEAANNVVSHTLGGFVSRENIAMLPLFALAPVRAAIGAQGAIESGRQLWDSLGNIAKEGPTQANLEALGESGTGALMSAVLFKSAFHGPALASKVGEVPDELLQGVGASKNVDPDTRAIVDGELKQRNLAPVPAEKLVPAIAKRAQDIQVAQEAATDLPETAKILTQKAHADYNTATKITPQQAHADELAAFHEEPAVQVAGEAEAAAPGPTLPIGASDAENKDWRNAHGSYQFDELSSEAQKRVLDGFPDLAEIPEDQKAEELKAYSFSQNGGESPVTIRRQGDNIIAEPKAGVETQPEPSKLETTNATEAVAGTGAEAPRVERGAATQQGQGGAVLGNSEQTTNDIQDLKNYIETAAAPAAPARRGVEETAAEGAQTGAGRSAEAVQGVGEVPRQQQALADWAKQNGREVAASSYDTLPGGPGGTAEHATYFDEASNRVVKVTHLGNYGFVPERTPEGIKPRAATPDEYLERVRLQNEIFGDDIKLEGVDTSAKPSMIIGEGEAGPRIVTSQEMRKGETTEAPHPSAPEIASYLEDRGFKKAEGYFAFERPEDNVLISDAKPDNFVKTERGIEPIDLHIAQEKPTQEVTASGTTQSEQARSQAGEVRQSGDQTAAQTDLQRGVLSETAGEAKPEPASPTGTVVGAAGSPEGGIKQAAAIGEWKPKPPAGGYPSGANEYQGAVNNYVANTVKGRARLLEVAKKNPDTAIWVARRAAQMSAEGVGTIPKDIEKAKRFEKAADLIEDTYRNVSKEKHTVEQILSGETGVAASLSKPTEIAHTVPADLGKALQVPQGTTALRATTADGKISVVRAADLKGANVLQGAGPFKKIEAGTIGRGNVFNAMKEKVSARPAAASGITAPTLGGQIVEALRPRQGAEDEANLGYESPPTVKDLEASEEPATAGSSEGAAPSEESPGPAASTSLKEWTTAHEQATYQGVTDALSRESGTQGVGATSDFRDQTSKRYATVNKQLNLSFDKRGIEDPRIRQEARENAYDILRTDLLKNVQDTGDPFKTLTTSGKEVSYSASLRAQTKTDQFLDLHENTTRYNEPGPEGEPAFDAITATTAAPKDSTRYHEAVNYVIDSTDAAVNDFSNRVGFEGHSPEAISAAVQAALKEKGFSTGVQGRPSKEAQEILSNPNFEPAVQQNVLAKIADAVKAHFDNSVFDDLRITNSGSSVGNAINGIASLFQPGKVQHLGNVVRGWWGAMAGKTLPRFTAVDREVGESGARYISSQIAAEPMSTLYASKVMEGLDRVSDHKLGAALTEDNLRSVKQQNLDKAATATTSEENLDYLTRAHQTATMVGKGKPFKDEAAYQNFLNEPQTQQAINRHKALWDAEVDPMYKQAQQIDPNEQLADRGAQTGARINLFALEPGAKGVVKVAGAPSSNLTNTFRKKSPFATEAKGTGDYETSYREIMANTFGRQLSIANYNGFVDSIVDKGLGQIGKPGQTIEIDGEGTTSFPLARRTIIQTGEGKTQAFAANQSLYVKNSLAGEFRNAVNVDPGATASALGKYLFRPINNAALYGLTDATVHVSNLATALFTRPAVTGSTLSDSFLSAFGRADVPVVLTKAVIKGFQDNKAQTAELANIGALRAESKSTTWGLGWSNKMIRWADKTTRLVLDDAYQQLAKEGLVQDTETNRREFVNQVGQYNRRTSSGLNRVMKDAGLAPFVTAGTTFNRLGVKMVGLQSGAAHTTALAHAITATNIAMKWVGTAALIGTANYLLTHNKGGGVLGRPGVPLGNIDTGTTDENDKPLSIPVGDIIGISRGLRVTGAKGAFQAKRAGLTAGDVKDAALRDVVNTVVSPYAGPAVRAGSAVLFNHAPGIGTPPVFHIVPPTGDDTQKSQIAHNIVGALADVNPAVSAFVAKHENPSLPNSEVMKRQLPRFTLRPTSSMDMMENYPEIVHKAQLNQYNEDTIYTARRLKPADRAAYIEQQLSQIPGEDQPRLEKALKSRRVDY